MIYQFPKIEHIDQVIPAIENQEGFIIAKKDNYDVVNYVSVVDAFSKDINLSTRHPNCPDTKAEAIRRECRGIIFNKQGELVRRPFHKFFNVDERLETHANQIDWSRPHVYLDKLDGSMVTPFLDKGYIRWGTKMGITEVAMQAEVFVARNHKYLHFAEECLKVGATPIFEWCSRQQRIVVSYPLDQLVLTAIRDMKEGWYWSYESMRSFAKSWDISFVSSMPPPDWHAIGEAENIEGVVIRFEDGHMLKLKSSWYVGIHKALSGLVWEKDILRFIYEDKLDDVLPFLSPEDQVRVDNYAGLVRVGFNNTLVQIHKAAKEAHEMGRKNFGLAEKMYPKMVRAVVFDTWNDENPDYSRCLLKMIQKHLNSQSGVDKIRSVVHAKPWKFREIE